MIKQVAIPPFLRCGIKRFYCGLASVVCAVKKYTNDTPYWCSPKTITASIAAIVGPSRLQDIRKAFITLSLPQVDWRSPLIIPKMTA